MALRVISYGGGVQSTALLVLAARGEIDFPVALFANVGDDSEHPATLRYVREVAAPYAAEHDIALHELRRIKRDGSVETLYGWMTRPGSRSLPIPVRMHQTGAPGTRRCGGRGSMTRPSPARLRHSAVMDGKGDDRPPRA